MGDREMGLFGKYRVERVDGKSIDRCIVLELHDPNSWPALRVWADTVEADGYTALAHDVRDWIQQASRRPVPRGRVANGEIEDAIARERLALGGDDTPTERND